jgi:2-keto-myo-inositol isomerase
MLARKEKPMDTSGKFGYSLNTSTIRNCKCSVPEELAIVAQAGYQGIELWVAEIDAYVQSGGTLKRLRGLLEQHGLQAPNLIAFFAWAHPDPVERKKGFEDARRVFEMARALGCPCVAAPPWGVADRTDLPLTHFADCFRELLVLGHQVGAKPILEFWGHARILQKLDEAVRVLALTNDPDGAMLADVFHMAKGGSRFEQLAELGGNQLALFHVNDYVGSSDVAQQTDQQRVYVGDGVAPWGVIMGALRQIGFAGMLSLELFNAEYEKAGALVVAQTGLAKLKRVVESN